MSGRALGGWGSIVVVGGLVALLAISAFGQSVTSVYFPSNCRNERFKPRTIVVTCADANFQIRQLRWQRWATSSAAGHGSARIKDPLLGRLRAQRRRPPGDPRAARGRVALRYRPSGTGPRGTIGSGADRPPGVVGLA